MIEGLPRLRQPTIGSCLLTAVQAVLQYHGDSTTLNELADYCQAFPGGFCYWQTALDGLATEFDVEDLEDDWDAVSDAVNNNEEPVVVTIARPDVAVIREDHAVVLVDVDEESVTYLDPMTGDFVQANISVFLLWWNTPGARAMLLRP